MQWKKFLAWLAFIGIGFFGGMAAGFWVFDAAPPVTQKPTEEVTHVVAASPTPKREVPIASPTATPPKQESRFLLTLSGESVCLYELCPDGSTLLLQQTGISLDQLRHEDYENLCRGYTVNSLEEAKALCEDFES